MGVWRFGIGMGMSIALWLGTAAPAAAQSVTEDVRCLLAGNFFAKVEKDPVKNQFAKVSAAFYLGRLDVRQSAQQIKAAVAAQGKTMNPTIAATVMNGCVRQLVQKSGMIGTQGAAPH